MKIYKSIISFVFVIVLLWGCVGGVKAVGVNDKLNFQGKIMNSSGLNVADGNYNFVFSLYNVASVGTSIWMETWNSGTTQVAVSGGIFNVDLGTYTSLSTVDFNNENLYLSINFNGDGEMLPRMRMTAVPYAMNAQKVNGLTVTNSTGTLTIPNTKVVSFGDAFSTVGAYAITISATAATGVTLPTSGVLSTLEGLETFKNKTITSGTVNGTIGLTFSGSGTDVDTAAGEALVLQGRAASTFQTTSGTIYLQPSGASVTGYVQIGSGAVSGTPDYLVLDNGNAEAGGTVGAMYYNSSLGKFRCYGSGGWIDCDNVMTGGNGMTGVGNTMDLGGLVTKDTRFNIGGTEVMFFGFGNGSIGFGTTGPSGAKVEIAGNLKLSVVGSSSAPNMLILGSGTSEPTTSVEGAMYFNTTASQFRCYKGGTWTNCALTSPGVELGTGIASTWSNNNAGVWISTTGTGDLIKAQQNGNDKFVVGNGGNLMVYATSENISKTTTGSVKTTDFSLVGSTMVNVGSTGDYLYIEDGAVPAGGQGTMSASTVVTTANVGAGAHAILRDDGDYLIIHGGGTTTASLWDGVSTTMTSRVISTGFTNVGLGSISLKRPDKKFLLVHGAGTSRTTIFDPMNLDAAVAGPVVCGGGISSGTNAFLRADGKYVILCGGRTNWGTYDPIANTYAAGTAVGNAFGAGAHALMRDDGTFLVFRGAGTTQHWIYNPFTNATGTMLQNPLVGTSVPTITTGSFSLRRNDGKYLILPGAQNSSNIYDPSFGSFGSFTAQSGAGYGPTVALAEGAQSLWRQDGKYILLIGNGSAVTNIIDQSVSTNQQFVAGPSLTVNAGQGLVAMMRPNGQYQVVIGNSNTTTNLYDMGFVIGGVGVSSELAYYETECMTSNAINSNSTLNWNNSDEGSLIYQVRTGNGSCSSAYRTISTSGLSIGASSTDNSVQVRVYLKRDAPKFADQDWGLRKSGMTRYRRTNKDPAIYDFTINNSAMLHKTQFDFANSNDASGPITQNLTNNSDGSLSLASIMANGTVNASDPTLYNGTFSKYPNLNAAAGPGTVVIRRPDGIYVVIGGSGPANAQYFDSVSQTYTSGSGTSIPTAATGLGALAVKRPDGKFLVVLGNGSTTTNIFDPQTNTFSVGATLTGGAGRGALAIPLPTGRTLIVLGNYTSATSIYDPVRNTFMPGPIPTAVVGGGAMALPSPNGTYLFVPGSPASSCTLSTTTNIFNPYRMSFTSTGAPAITTGVGPGAFAFQRSDGQWVIVHGGGTNTSCNATTRTNIYNPYSNTMIAGPALLTAAQKGAHALQRPDGNWLIVVGGGLSVTNIYEEKAGAFTTGGIGTIGSFTAGPALPNNVGEGAVVLQKDDGKFFVITGTGSASSDVGTTLVNEYDALWVSTGFYRSEQVNIDDLDSNSTLSWRVSPTMDHVSAEVKTASSQAGLQTSSGREVPVSGGMISPNSGETWIQVGFNFKRIFPSFGGVYSDTWYNGGSPVVCTQRVLDTPILKEYKVTKSTNLVDLKSDGVSMFRVSSNGSIYASSGGVINTGGADLAENYSSIEKLEKGMVVSIDPISDHSVKRSNYQYQPDLLGVVSSDPGFVAGSYTEDSYPIALVGRVPVLVTTENGQINVGDKITSSSLSGYAMKASKSGRVLGEALESMAEKDMVECPSGGIYFPNKKCGKINMFVNLTDYNGDNMAVMMEESGFNSNWINNGSQYNSQDKILAFLKQQRDEATDSPQYESEVYADNVYATNQIIAPAIFTDLLQAKRIKADSIEGIEILTDKISSLSAEINKKENTPISFFRSLVEFWNNVIFKGTVKFESTPEFNANTAGFAVVNKYSDSVDIKFDTKFDVTPIVNITLEGDAPLGNGYGFMVTNRTEDGFTIKLNRLADSEIKFSWIALAVKDPKTFQMPTPTPMIIVEPIETNNVSTESGSVEDKIRTGINNIIELPIESTASTISAQNY